MSIRIKRAECIGCGRCIEACPGNLIKQASDGRAYIRHEKDCWGCTSCLKECPAGAVKFFLGADVGGRGSTLSYSHSGDIAVWTVVRPDGNEQTIEVNKKDSNKY